ncbi:MAG: hypothetical protein HC933_21445 [Pleurocapsa sp. SU_196_0]|nr:hypothetical protein [Pleurocapsa sp. SU_196_0]
MTSCAVGCVREPRDPHVPRVHRCHSRGNRADVVFGLDLGAEAKMQSIASSTGAPATVFVGVSEQLFDDEAVLPVRLRFFTPEIEESICGHGTIAALEALQNVGVQRLSISQW